MNTTVEYLGLKLKSPILAGSCGLTSNIDNLVRLEEMGAGAVVLKSIFEEQIIYDIKRNTHVYAPVGNYGDSYEYIAQHVADDSVAKHFALIRELADVCQAVSGCRLRRAGAEHGHHAFRDLPLGRRCGAHIQQHRSVAQEVDQYTHQH